MAAKTNEPTSWTVPSTMASVLLNLRALYRMTSHKITSMAEMMIESVDEVPGATSKLCGPVPKNMTATTTVTAIIMPEPMSPTASRARSPRASSMPSAGTSGNRVRKYNSVIPSLPHAKTLQLFNVIAQLRSSGGRFSVNWGVLGVRGKGASALEQRGDAPPIAATGARATARGLLATLEDVPTGSRRSKKLGRQEKCAPMSAPSRLLFRLFNARLATARLIDQCGLTALAVLTAPSLDRRLAGNLVLDHGLANR